MKVYISLPIKGGDYQKQKELAKNVEIFLMYEGYEVANPFQNGLPKEATEVEHMRADINMLCECDAIIMLPGWEQSKGCLNEFHTACGRGMEVYYYKPKTLL